MIKNAILICDEKDDDLGEYFSSATEYASNLINQKNTIKQVNIPSEKCNATYLDEIEFPKHNEKTLFVINSHGNDNSFLRQGFSPFIKDTINNCDLCLNGGLVYSGACSAGKEFGSKITEKNASFYGYIDKFEVLAPMHKKISLECHNYGLYKLLEGHTLEEAKKASKDRHNYHIDNSDLNIFSRASLTNNRDRIVIYGKCNTIFF